MRNSCRKLSIAWLVVALASSSQIVKCFDPAAPWTAPPGTSFPYKGLETNLDELARKQASPDKWISLMTFTGGIRRFGLNCLYSLAKYGNMPHYIVATFEKKSLDTCMQLNLPCFDATQMIRVQIEDGAHNFGSRESHAMWWAKQNITLSLLKQGYIVHGTDADVVFFRDVRKSYGHIFEKVWADGAFLTEEAGPGSPDDMNSYINMVNAGVYALRPSNRTFHFMEHWISGWEHMDQVWLNRIMGLSYMFCDSRASCSSLKRHHKAAFYRHPHLFPGTSCIQPLGANPCDTRRLYVHFLCTVGWNQKAKAWKEMDLWFVEEDGTPMWADGAEVQGTHNGTKHAFCPCPGIAWPNVDWSPTRRSLLDMVPGLSNVASSISSLFSKPPAALEDSSESLQSEDAEQRDSVQLQPRVGRHLL